MGENRSLDDFLSPEDDGAGDEGTASGRSTPGTDGDAGADPTGRSEADESAAERTAGSAGDSGDAGEADAGAATEADGATDSAHDGDVPSTDPPRTTYRWSADGDDCPACGATVDRQWRDGDRFVCADCKDW